MGFPSQPGPGAAATLLLSAWMVVGCASSEAEHTRARTPVPRTRTLPAAQPPAFPHAPPEELGISSEKLEQLGDEITRWVAHGDLVGAELLIVKQGRCVFHEAYGWSDREELRPLERNSIWGLKSMAKPFTALAVLMLEEAGALSLDDPLTHYLPSYAGDQRVTLRELLAQTSGDGGEHGGGGYNIYDFDSLGGWVEDWAEQVPTGTFGEFRYSNFNYAALGYVVEVITGAPVEHFTRSRILEPLELTETYTAFAPDLPWAHRVPGRYRWSRELRDYERFWSARDRQPWSFYPAALGLWGTAGDYARFVTLWMNGGRHADEQVLAERSVELALHPHGYRAGEALYGYGWFVEGMPGTDGMPLTFRHGGHDGTVAIAFPADDAVVVYLTHSKGGADHVGALQNRLTMLGIFDHPGPSMEWAADSDVVEVELSLRQRGRYVGTYREEALDGDQGPGLVVRVWEQSGHLRARMGEAGVLADHVSDLVFLGRDQFAFGRYQESRLVAVDPQARLRFGVGAEMDNGRARSLEIVAEDEVEFLGLRVHPSTRSGE